MPSKNQNTMINYEYVHNPDLHKYSRLGKFEEMRKTTQAGGTQGGFAGGQTNLLSKAGQTQVNFGATAQGNQQN